ncbi:MAG TPA: HAMP domain-containing sensor histidine kinase [Chthoniobacteraceae bacterium]|jgi:signal transduction histidine kinase
MKKLALLFLLAVFVPSLALAWLALGSLRAQQLVVEQQEAQLQRGAADALVAEVNAYLAERQREFALQVGAILGKADPRVLARSFDELLVAAWAPASVGFAVTLQGQVLAPARGDRPPAAQFLADNRRFLSNREQLIISNVIGKSMQQSQQPAPPQQQQVFFQSKTKGGAPAQTRRPQERATLEEEFVPRGEAEFQQIIGAAEEGTLARFLQNQLHVYLWYRSPQDPDLVFGASLDLPRLRSDLQQIVAAARIDAEAATLVLLDESGQAVARTPGAAAPRDWKNPFVRAEVGDALPHWEAAVFLLHPNRMAEVASTTRWTLTLLIVTLLGAISTGGGLIIADLRRQVRLARQKTDFVSNVSHELKTPLTSIRMFSELLSEGRVNEPDKQRSYSRIIAGEAARLTRLINNVLDFSRGEHGEKQYYMRELDLAELTSGTVAAYQPQLESSGFTVDLDVPRGPVRVNADADAISQVLLNLLSNAEKYSSERKEVKVELTRADGCAELTVHDRGTGIPPRMEEKVFEQFFRVNDSLSSGVQGCGLGLTLARQISRAHGGDVLCTPRDGGGSSFTLRLPLLPEEAQS